MTNRQSFVLMVLREVGEMSCKNLAAEVERRWPT